jgi:hypothetical protein
MTAPARGVTEPEGDRMSNTDKTRPWWVRMADAPMVTCVPLHDHRFGPCNLPNDITADSASLSFQRGRCYWRSTAYQRFERNDAGSREWSHVRRDDRRRGRHQARRELGAYCGED